MLGLLSQEAVVKITKISAPPLEQPKAKVWVKDGQLYYECTPTERPTVAKGKGVRLFCNGSVETDSEGNQVEKEYKVDVQQATEHGIVATFTDMNTGEKYEINTNELHASFAFLIPIAVVVGEALLEHLIAMGLAFVIAGVTYTLASEIVPTLRNKNYDHYAAYLKTKEGVYIGNPISLSEAISRLNGKDFETNNVWSKTSGLAKKVYTSNLKF